MTHLDEMAHYIRLTEARVDQEIEVISESLIYEQEDTLAPLMESLSDIVFKFQNYRERDGSDEYVMGVEEGLNLAASMLIRVLESHGRTL